ncbi:hypothetical protein KHQ89_01635 [Mycoplasmatota bacterium]|nr:hypothetical protein KHQ89_01635 [Mycoplasmatota bacterium]
MIYLFLCLYVLFEFVIQRKKQTNIENEFKPKTVFVYVAAQFIGSLVFLLWVLPPEASEFTYIGIAVLIKLLTTVLRLFLDSRITQFRKYQLCENEEDKNKFISKYIKIRFLSYHFIELFATLAIWSSVNYTDSKESILPFYDFETSFYITLFIVLTIVANLVFKIYFSQYNPQKDIKDDQVKSGALIGSMERIVMMILLIAGQWIGLTIIVAAKSIARFKQLDDKGFSEYYLIGTLYSIIFVIITYYAFVQSVFI